MFKKLLQLPLWGLLLLVAIIAVIILFVFSSLNPWNPLNYFAAPKITVDTSRSAVVKEIQALNRLETASFTIEKIIEAGNEGNLFQEVLYGDRLLLIAHGRVVAGVDLSKVKTEDVVVDGRRLTVALPATEIFSTQLDNRQTKVYDRQQGLLSRGDKDLETAARQAAEASIRQAACDGGILEEAAANARNRLTEMYTMVNFDSVEIRVSPGNCSA